MLELIKKSEKPDITVFVPFTRKWALKRFLPSLEAIILPRENTELAFYADTNDESIIKELRDFLQAKKEKYNGCKLYVSGNRPPTDTNISVQRNRIVDMKEKSKWLIQGSWVFGLEDDTLAPPDAFQKLIISMEDEDVGFVEGVQAGRHGIKMVGVWKCDNVNDPKVQQTLIPGESMDRITGGGFYCYLTTDYLYREVKYRYEAECFGPDVCFVMDVCKMGYRCYVDWTIKTIHMTEKKDILVDDKVVGVKWLKNRDGLWKLQPYING